MIRGGHDNTEPFERYLIEEQDVDGSGVATGMGFVSFLEQIAHDVMMYMKWRQFCFDLKDAQASIVGVMERMLEIHGSVFSDQIEMRCFVSSFVHLHLV